MRFQSVKHVELRTVDDYPDLVQAKIQLLEEQDLL
jgi:hypothetical protein